MEKINLFGAGGHSLVVREIIAAGGNVVGRYYDDAPRAKDAAGVEICKADTHNVEGKLIVSIGNNAVRRQIVGRYDVEYATAIHPSALISPSARIGEGTVVMHGAIVQANARIGRHCIVNTSASVDHECEIGDFVHISPHAALCGDIKVGEMTHIGAGSVVISGVRIGRKCVIGAGSVVLADIPDGSVAYGNPCRVVRQVEE